MRTDAGEPVSVGGPRPRALLAMLLLDAGHLVSLDRLIDGQYGDRPPSEAANAVQAQVSRLRRHLPSGLIESHGSGYRLAVDRDDVDLHRFERLARDGRALLAAGRHAAAATVLREALDLWRGPAFADVADAPFAAPQALRLDELRLAATEDLYEAELSLPGTAPPVAGLRDLLSAHPFRERTRGLLMRALHAAGRQAEALAVYDEGRRLLADELGADPSPELAALHLEILRGPQERTSLTGPPAQLTSFVGREDELAHLASLRDARLITIVGPGGTGKTRLAIEHALRTDTDTPTAFTDLTLVDPTPPADRSGEGAVARVVWQALGLREPALRPPGPGATDPVRRLVSALAEQELLLILDNCEHVIDETATLVRRLLSACPGLRILATSREPLGLTGEHLVPLTPLPVPPPGAEPPQDPLAYPAVRLFAERAAAVRPGFAGTSMPRTRTPGNPATLELDAGTLADISRICADLDGLPLAIELAAARVRTFRVAEIAERLAEHGRFSLLSRGDRTAAARHRTLRAVVEWSWSLLDPDEQALARRLAVFTGGATLEAVERVCAPDRPDEGAEVLAGLVDKSLVETDGERYQMLDTIRLFCLERLAAAGEEAATRRAHAAWFLEFAARADDHLYRKEQLDWLARLSADDANLRAALRWSAEHDPATGLRLTAALAMYWWLSGRRGQAAPYAARLLDRVGTEPPAGLAEEYVMTVLHAVPEPGSPHWRQAREIVTSLGRPMRHRFGVALWSMIAGPPGEAEDERGRRETLSRDPWSRALGDLGTALLKVLDGAPAEAEPELDRVRAAFARLGERWGTAQALDWLAVIASWRGDWARARRLWREALELLEELGALDELADVLIRRAAALWRAGDAAAARADCARVAELERRLGRPELTASSRLQLGEIARHEGDLDEAERLLAEALAGSESGAFTSAGTRSHALTALGRLAEARGDAERAAGLHAEALAAALGSPMAADLADAAEGLAGLRITGSPGVGSVRDGSGGKDGAEEAAWLLGMAVALRGTAVAGDRDVARTAAAATAILGAEGFAAAYARGAAMSKDDALSALRPSVLGDGR
ncbi:BTAD domain-containing putative transcriptional regulator [Nonomuraea sp. NPDC049309]|uniref:BTAD domain-containing putative transcriptional regulator n=1 Tax=Nonomuraea sp. NPDC049309 TaxID=3364350 RepID=UPI00371E1AA4